MAASEQIDHHSPHHVVPAIDLNQEKEIELITTDNTKSEAGARAPSSGLHEVEGRQIELHRWRGRLPAAALSGRHLCLVFIFILFYNHFIFLCYFSAEAVCAARSAPAPATGHLLHCPQRPSRRRG
jgi:hypothetical protein